MKSSLDFVLESRPHMDNYWIDSHAHLMSESLIDDFDDIIKRAIENDVQRICIICGTLKEIEDALERVEGNLMFDLAIGVHPTSTQEVSKEELDAMMDYLKHPQVKFVGEIGLDYYWDDSYKALQKEVFIKQIKIANEYNLPITIHIREASDDVYEILKHHPVNRKGIVHCFTEDVESAKRFIDLGFYVGIAGIVTFKNGENIKELVRHLPFDKLLSETDSPYLAPVPKRGKRNDSSNVMYVGEEIARLKEMDVKQVQKQLITNYKRLIGE